MARIAHLSPEGDIRPAGVRKPPVWMAFGFLARMGDTLSAGESGFDCRDQLNRTSKVMHRTSVPPAGL
jgi:hypothetical protein